MRLDREERDGIDQRRQRRVVGVGPDFLRHVLPVALQAWPIGTRPREVGPPAVSAGDLASDLRLVHRLRRRQAAELVQEIKKHDRPTIAATARARRTQTASAACLERVDQPLNEIGATRHLTLRLLPPEAWPALDFGLVGSDFSAFISLILRCSVRRLMPSFFAAAVMLPLVAASACMIRRFSVS